MKHILRQKVSQLLWVCNQSRPDICFDVSNIASNIKNATTKHLIDVNKTINNRPLIKTQAIALALGSTLVIFLS